ncbi:MAG: hypothetical protein ACKV19_20690 [Verrucomicrobiales bacterium]
MTSPDEFSLPLERWAAYMQAAIGEISDIGPQLLAQHRGASETASQIADQWRLQDRLEDERAALGNALRTLHGIWTAIDATREFMNRTGMDGTPLRQSMRECADAIESGLPPLQRDFMTIRHCALDLLRWERKFAHIEGSELPNDYRAGYARLLDYAPVFRPGLEAMQRDLLQQSCAAPVSPELQRLLSALSHYLAVMESARMFVKSVVSPPMDLMFQDTESFQEGWQLLDPALKGRLATELNDSCQLLLYDSAAFHQLVENIQQPLSGGLIASIHVLPVDTWRVVFTMDEDPVFGQIMVTLLRVVQADHLGDALRSLAPMLYGDFSNEHGEPPALTSRLNQKNGESRWPN